MLPCLPGFVSLALALALPSARAAEEPATLEIDQEAITEEMLLELPDTPRGDALRLSLALTRAAQAGDLERARVLRRRFLALDPEILESVPWPPIIHAVGATERPPELDSLVLWTGSLPEDELVLVFWHPRRGDKRRLFAALDAQVADGGPPVVAIVADPSARDQQLARAQARETPGIAMGQVTGAAALAWQSELSQDCLYIEQGAVRQRVSCRELLPPPLSGAD